MLDDNFKVNKEEAKVYPPLPKNVYQVELLDIELKDAKGKYAKAGDKNFSFQFTLLAGQDKDGTYLRGRNVWDNFVSTTLYIGKNGKNTLYQIVEAFLDRSLTVQEEAEGLSGLLLNSFVGGQLKIFIDHNISNGKVYNNIISYMPVDIKINSLTPEEKEAARVKNKKQEFQLEPEMPENFLQNEQNDLPNDNGDGLTEEQRAKIN